MKNNIIAVDVSKNYILHVDKILERSKSQIIEWFETPFKDFKVNAYIYKDISALREGLKRRGFGLYPSHMVACMIDEDIKKSITRSVNFYEPPVISDEKSYNKKEYNQVILHELIHYITDILFGKLPEWLTEGIAVYLDGKYKNDISNLLQLINSYEIPNVSEMKGDFFVVKTCNNEMTEQEAQKKETIVYDGYDLSYLMVRYIIEVHGKKNLFEIMKNKERIKELEQNILIKAIEYFNLSHIKENTIKN